MGNCFSGRVASPDRAKAGTKSEPKSASLDIRADATTTSQQSTILIGKTVRSLYSTVLCAFPVPMLCAASAY